MPAPPPTTPPAPPHALILSPSPSKGSLYPRPFPCEAHSFRSLHGPIRKAHRPCQGTHGTHGAPAPAGYHSHPNNDMTKSLLRLNGIRLWENTREHLLWKYLFKPKNVKTKQTKNTKPSDQSLQFSSPTPKKLGLESTRSSILCDGESWKRSVHYSLIRDLLSAPV